MGKRVIILSIFIITGVALLLAVNLGRGQGKEAFKGAMASAHDVEDLPIDANAYDLRHEKQGIGGWKSTDYKTYTVGQNLIAFYKEHMA